MSKRRAFTLIELLVVIAIIAILAAILFPVFNRAKDAAKKTAAMTQMKQLGIGLMMYISDNDGVYVPATNYDAALENPERIWTVPLFTYVKDKRIFVAPGTSNSDFADNWETRHRQSIGYSDATAYSTLFGLPAEKICLSGEVRLGCSAFYSVASENIMRFPANTALFAVTPHGRAGSKYRGFIISADNGTSFRADFTTFTDLDQAVPLASDRDLVLELDTLTAAELKPILAPYNRTGKDDGSTPVVFADGHAKSYSAKAIGNGGSGIIWRFR